MIVGLLIASGVWAGYQIPRPERELLVRVGVALHLSLKHLYPSWAVQSQTDECRTRADELRKAATELDARDRAFTTILTTTTDFDAWMMARDSLYAARATRELRDSQLGH